MERSWDVEVRERGEKKKEEGDKLLMACGGEKGIYKRDMRH